MFKKARGDEGHSSIIARNCKINGNMHSEGHLIIKGNIEGILDAERVVIEKEGRFNGKMNVNVLSIEGHFEGEMNVADKLTLEESAEVTAEVMCHKLIVKGGAVLNGNISVKQPQIAQMIPVEKIISPDAQKRLVA